MSILAEWLTTNTALGPKTSYALVWAGALAICWLAYVLVKGF